jgi:hypothetical protein
MSYDSTRTDELPSLSMRVLLKDERRSEGRALKEVDEREDHGSNADHCRCSLSGSHARSRSFVKRSQISNRKERFGT